MITEKKISDPILFFQIPHRFLNALMFDHVLRPAFGLNKTDIRTLMGLRFLSPVSMQRLGNWVGIPKGSFTQVVDKLVRSGLVVRSENPKDRRMVLVSITEKGKETAVAVDADLRTHLDNKLKSLKADEVASLIKALETIREITTILKRGDNEKSRR